MNKKFYRNTEKPKVFFEAQLNICSHAYGDAVRKDFIAWRGKFIEEWNAPKNNFLLLEGGDVGGVSAKVNTGGTIHPAPLPKEGVIVKKPKVLCPLRCYDLLYEVSAETATEGTLIVNGKPTEINLGRELKAWGISAIFQTNQNRYYLFVIGKPQDSETCELCVYPIKNGMPEQTPAIRRPCAATMAARSFLYCFGQHIFVIHDAKLDYFYFRPQEMLLENVAIGTNEENQGKPMCQHVCPPVVVDEYGFVYWQSGNEIFSFAVGTPGKLMTLSPGELHDIHRIQCFKNVLFMYCRNQLRREMICYSYVRTMDGGYDVQVFNRGAINNVFYKCDKDERKMHYVKIPQNAQMAQVSVNTGGNETILSEFSLGGSQKIFCNDGYVYLGADYVGRP